MTTYLRYMINVNYYTFHVNYYTLNVSSGDGVDGVGGRAQAYYHTLHV